MTTFNTDFLDYFPIRHGLAPSQIGLKRLRSEASDKYGKIKEKVFQISPTFRETQKNKLACREERLSKYYQKNINTDLRQVSHWIGDKLSEEYPEYFKIDKIDKENWCLECKLTEDIIIVKNGVLSTDTQTKSFDKPIDAFDALAMQVEEDLVYQVILSSDYKQDACHAIHLCQANGWSAEWAIHKTFDEIHARVPRIKEIIRDTSKILQAIVEGKFPTERIGAVNFRTSPILNRHPEIPVDERHVPFHHKNHTDLYLRFERQTVNGFPNENAFLFTIHTYLSEISPKMPQDKWNSFKLCMEGESEGANPHGFLERNRDEILKWLDANS